MIDRKGCPFCSDPMDYIWGDERFLCLFDWADEAFAIYRRGDYLQEGFVRYDVSIHAMMRIWLRLPPPLQI